MFLAVVVLFVPSLTAGSEYPAGRGGGGGFAHSSSLLLVLSLLRSWSPSVTFDAQWSPGPANSLSLGLKVGICRGSRLPCLVLCGF